jgi:hypothetical protein
LDTLRNSPPLADLAVVLLTAERERAHGPGVLPVAACLRKPVAFDDLVSTVARWSGKTTP